MMTEPLTAAETAPFHLTQTTDELNHRHQPAFEQMQCHHLVIKTQ
jgi:hypothetical protein